MIKLVYNIYIRGSILQMNIILLDNTMHTEKFISVCKNTDEEITVNNLKTDTEFIDTALKTNTLKNANALFVNIDLNGANGLDLVYEVKDQLSSTPVIFMTSNLEKDIFKIYLKDSYFKPFGIFPYPLSEDTIKTILNQLFCLQADKNKYFIVKNRKSKNVILKTSDIIYIESDKRKALINTPSDTYEMYIKINELLNCLPDFFLQPHNSFLVNVKEIDSVDARNITLKNRKVIPISNRYKKTFFCDLTNMLKQ